MPTQAFAAAGTYARQPRWIRGIVRLCKGRLRGFDSSCVRRVNGSVRSEPAWRSRPRPWRRGHMVADPDSAHPEAWAIPFLGPICPPHDPLCPHSRMWMVPRTPSTRPVTTHPELGIHEHRAFPCRLPDRAARGRGGGDLRHRRVHRDAPRSGPVSRLRVRRQGPTPCLHGRFHDGEHRRGAVLVAAAQATGLRPDRPAEGHGPRHGCRDDRRSLAVQPFSRAVAGAGLGGLHLVLLRVHPGHAGKEVAPTPGERPDPPRRGC